MLTRGIPQVNLVVNPNLFAVLLLMPLMCDLCESMVWLFVTFYIINANVIQSNQNLDDYLLVKI